MEKKIFGNASDFYRVRLLKLVEEGYEEVPWIEGPAFYAPVEEDVTVSTVFEVQLISINEGGVRSTTRFDNKKEATAFLIQVREDLTLLTVNEFRLKYRPE